MNRYHVSYHTAAWVRVALVEADSPRQAQRILQQELARRKITATVGDAQEVLGVAQVDIGLECDLARNMFGKLDQQLRRRLQAVVDRPTQHTWGDTYCIIVSDGWMTLWQAVLRVEPTFPNRGPCEGEQWTRVPTRDLLLRALRYATH